MKIGAITLVTLLAVGFLYFVVSDSVDADKALASSQPAEVVEAKAMVRDLASSESGASAAPQLEKRTVVASFEPEESGVVVASAKAPTVRGRVILTDELGVEHSNASGEFTVVLWNGESGEYVSVEVIEGEFELEANGCKKLTIDTVVLGGSYMVLEFSDAEYRLDGEPIVVRVLQPRILLLAVRDRLSGMHLSQVTVATRSSRDYDDEEHPGPLAEQALLLTNATSPVEVRPWEIGLNYADKVFFVHSPGYAWRSIHLDLTRGGNREIRMEQGGDLVLHLIGELAEVGPRLRLRRSGQPGGPSYLELPASVESAIEITGLSPGKYRASVELGEWYENPQSLGAQEVVIEAGTKSEYELLVTPPPTVVKARLAGTLFLPPTWGFTLFKIEADLQRSETGGAKEDHILSSTSMEQLAGDSGAWAFDYGAMPTGDYELYFSGTGSPSELGYKFHIELGPAGNEQVQFRIPPPTTVVIRVLEEPSGEPAELDRLSWTPKDPKGKHIFAYNSSAAVPGQQGYFEFQAPTGQIRLCTTGTGYESLLEVLDLRPGRNEFTYRLNRECPLVIVFRDDKTLIPIGDGWSPQIEHLDGEGELLYISNGGSTSFETALSRPGRYVFEMPELEGFEPIPKQTISVQSGERTRHVVQLVRKP